MASPVYVVQFGFTNLTASGTPKGLQVGGADRFYVPFNGTILALHVAGNDDRAAGQALFAIAKNGVSLASPTVALNGTTPRYAQAEVEHDLRAVKEGDYLEIPASVDGDWLPATLDATATLILMVGATSPG